MIGLPTSASDVALILGVGNLQTRLALASVLGPFGAFADIHSTHWNFRSEFVIHDTYLIYPMINVETRTIKVFLALWNKHTIMPPMRIAVCFDTRSHSY